VGEKRGGGGGGGPHRHGSTPWVERVATETQAVGENVGGVGRGVCGLLARAAGLGDAHLGLLFQFDVDHWEHRS